MGRLQHADVPPGEDLQHRQEWQALLHCESPHHVICHYVHYWAVYNKSISGKWSVTWNLQVPIWAQWKDLWGMHHRRFTFRCATGTLVPYRCWWNRNCKSRETKAWSLQMPGQPPPNSVSNQWNWKRKWKNTNEIYLINWYKIYMQGWTARW